MKLKKLLNFQFRLEIAFIKMRFSIFHGVIRIGKNPIFRGSTPVKAKFIVREVLRNIILGSHSDFIEKRISEKHCRKYSLENLVGVKPKYLIDCQCLQSRTFYRGIGRYTLSLVFALAKKDKNRIVAIGFSSHLPFDNIEKISNLITTKKLSNLKIIIFDTLTEKKFSPVMECQLELASLIIKLSPENLIVPSVFEHPVDVIPYEPLLIEQINTACLIHDLIPLHFEESLLPTKYLKRLYLNNLLRSARFDRVLAVSNFSAADYQTHFQKIVVKVIGGAGFKDGPRAEGLPLNNRAGILCIAAETPHKNVQTLINAYQKLNIEIQVKNPLYIVGTSKNYINKLLAGKPFGLSDKIHIFENLTDSELENLYLKTRLVVVPSLMEGLSMPVIEGWHYGAVSLGGRGTVLEEVIYSQEALFDPSDFNDMSRLMNDFLVNDDKWAIERSRALQRIVHFDWEEVAEKLTLVFEHGSK